MSDCISRLHNNFYASKISISKTFNNRFLRPNLLIIKIFNKLPFQQYHRQCNVEIEKIIRFPKIKKVFHDTAL